MSCPSSGSTIVQMAHGQGSVTFAQPTLRDSMIVVLLAFDTSPTSGSIAPTDNGSNFYQTGAGSPEFSTGFVMETDVWYTFTGFGHAHINSATTITNNATGGSSPWMWAYELNTSAQGAIPNVSNECTGDANSGTSASPSGSGLFLDPFCAAGAGPPVGNVYACFAVCAVGGVGGAITAVTAPWTLDVIQGGNAAAYLLETNLSATDTVHFTNSSSTPFCIVESAYEALLSVPTPFCGCQATQAVGNPLI